MTTERWQEIAYELVTQFENFDPRVVLQNACERIAELEAKLAGLARHTAIVEADLLRLLPSEPAGGAS